MSAATALPGAAAGRRGLLLVNLGTPDAPTTGAVRRYLREFLSDDRVIDLSPLARWLLVNLIILPVRPARSAAAYRSVWMEQGSPLLVHSRALTAAVAERLGEGWAVELGMRYGKPSLPDALSRLAAAGTSELVVLPLYPQYATSSTGSSLKRIFELAAGAWNTPPLTVVSPFFADEGFLSAWTQVAAPVLDQAAPDHVLLSFHGVPERHMRKSDPTGAHCLASTGCCDALVTANRFCYRAQCYATARSLAQRLGLSADRYSVSFQSRLGRTPWVRPYTDHLLPELARRGVKRLVVLCPSFVADCLETVEEIGIRAKAQFAAAGGQALTLVPSLNAHPAWVDAVAGLVRRAAGATRTAELG